MVTRLPGPLSCRWAAFGERRTVPPDVIALGEIVTLAGQFRPDVVLLDIGLPKVNGYEACRRIRQQSWGRKVILIAVTGWGQEEDRRQQRPVAEPEPAQE